MSDKFIDLAGTATQPQFKVSVTSLDFGTVNIGATSPTKAVELRNDGDGDLLVKELAIVAGMGAIRSMSQRWRRRRLRFVPAPR